MKCVFRVKERMESKLSQKISLEQRISISHHVGGGDS